jgi:hypothetical protein
MQRGLHQEVLKEDSALAADMLKGEAQLTEVTKELAR